MGIADAGGIGYVAGILFWFIFIPYWLSIRKKSEK